MYFLYSSVVTVEKIIMPIGNSKIFLQPHADDKESINVVFENANDNNWNVKNNKQKNDVFELIKIELL